MPVLASDIHTIAFMHHRITLRSTEEKLNWSGDGAQRYGAAHRGSARIPPLAYSERVTCHAPRP